MNPPAIFLQERTASTRRLREGARREEIVWLLRLRRAAVLGKPQQEDRCFAVAMQRRKALLRGGEIWCTHFTFAERFGLCAPGFLLFAAQRARPPPAGRGSAPSTPARGTSPSGLPSVCRSFLAYCLIGSLCREGHLFALFLPGVLPPFIQLIKEQLLVKGNLHRLPQPAGKVHGIRESQPI